MFEHHPTIARYGHGPWTVLRLTGDFDMSWSDILRDECAEAVIAGTSRPQVLLDLSAVTFLDSTALGIIAGLHKTAVAHSGHLALAGAQGSVRRLLHITQLDEAIANYATLQDALRYAEDEHAVQSPSAP